MSDLEPSQDTTQPEPVPIHKSRRSILDSTSLFWALPIITLVIALGAVWRHYNEQGPLIEVSFHEAAGIRAQETQLRYRDIAVGMVEEIGFSDDLAKVIATIRVDKELAPFIDADAEFWVVRPEVSAQGVSGLDTVLSGVYIRGSWDNRAGRTRRIFEGLEKAPLLGLGREGITFTLRSSAELPGVGTPILFKGVRVGAVGQPSVLPDGSGVTADAVIYEPYTGFVTTSTRFWDVSGFDFSLGASGARLSFTSLASLVSGGITFETIGSGGEPIIEGATYTLFDSEDVAREDFLSDDDGRSVDLALVFEENLPGLSAGAPVELGGLRVGNVTSVNGIVNPDRFGDRQVRLIASVKINPGRIGLGDDADEGALLDYLDARIAEGLRGQLANASLFTGGLKIRLVDIPGAEALSVDRTSQNLPLIPTAPADVADVRATAQSAIQRVSDLPIEELMQSITGFLDNAATLIGNAELQNAPGELNSILSALRVVVESERIQGLPDDIGNILQEIETAGATLNRLIVALESQETIEKLTDTIESANTATDALPDLVNDLRRLLANAQSIPLSEFSQDLADLLNAIEVLVNRADGLLAREDLQAVPAELRGILKSVRSLTEDEAVQGFPGRTAELFDSVQQTVDTMVRVMTDLETANTVARLSEAIEDVARAAEGLPEIVDEAQRIVEGAGEVPLNQLAQQISTLLDTANRLIDQDSMQRLPDELNASLASLRRTLDELQSGGLVANANATFASAREAADALAVATASLPKLAEELRGVALQASATLAAYSDDSQFTRDTRTAIREVESAARAIEQLARTIERSPNSILFGR